MVLSKSDSAGHMIESLWKRWKLIGMHALIIELVLRWDLFWTHRKLWLIVRVAWKSYNCMWPLTQRWKVITEFCQALCTWEWKFVTFGTNINLHWWRVKNIHILSIASKLEKNNNKHIKPSSGSLYEGWEAYKINTWESWENDWD